MTYNPLAVPEVAAAIKSGKRGAYAYVVYSDGSGSFDTSSARGFEVISERSQTGVESVATHNRIVSTKRDAKGARRYRDVRGRFVAMKLATNEAFAIITPETGDYIRDGLVRFLYRLRSKITRARLKSVEMLRIVESLAGATNTDVVIKRSLLRSKRQEATISYKAETLDTLYEVAQENNAHVQGFDFALQKRDGDILLHAGLKRNGQISYRAGNLDLFIKQFVEAVARTVKLRTDMLSGRARSEQTGIVKPLKIKFAENLFDRDENVRAFLRTLGKIKHGEMTLYHRNPYLHASFFDFFDNSEVDVFLDATDSLVLVPQFDSTRSSLFRLCQKIFEEFEEGELTEGEGIVTSSSSSDRPDDDS